MTYAPGQPLRYQPYSQQPYGQYGQQPAPYPPRRSTNGFAIASLILGILGGVLLSVIFGIIALNQTKGGRQGGRGMAIAGLALSGAWMLLTVLAVALAIIFDDGSVRATDIKPGDCIETAPADMARVEWLPKVSCDEPHEGEVYALLPVSGDTFPGQARLDDEYEKKCVTELDTYSRNASADPAYQIYVLYPTQETWDQGHRRVVTCLTSTSDKRTGSVKE
jgi:Domain of unknown function (DUF4190)/Septum formation